MILQTKKCFCCTAIAHCLLSISISVVSFLIITLSTYMTYTTTDDVYIMQVISGCFNGTPMDWVPFLSPFLVKAISFLYRLFPSQNCYVLLQIILLVGSTAIINLSIFRQLAKHLSSRDYVIGSFVCIITDWLLCWTFVRMHMYYVSILTGTATISIILCSDFERKKDILQWAVILILFLFCVSYSIDTSYAILAFIGLAIFLRVVLAFQQGGQRGHALVSCFVLFAVLVTCMMVTMHFYKVERTRYCGDDYEEWNNYRISYWDYNVTPYDENPEMYNQVGWTKEFYQLTRKMYFMDERFSVNELSQLIAKFDRTTVSISGKSFNQALLTAWHLFSTDKQATGLFIMMCGFWVATLVYLSHKKARTILVLFSFFAFGLGGLMCFYLAFRGRFPLRAFAVTAIPSIVFMEMCMIDLTGSSLSLLETKSIDLCDSGIKDTTSTRKHAKLNKTTNRVPLILSVLVICISLFFYTTNSVSSLANNNIKQYYATEKAKEATLYTYVSTHKSNLYVFDWSTVATYNPFPDLKQGDLTNLFCWGGARLYTYPYNEQLEINGLDSLSSKDFGRDNLFFISNSMENIDLLGRFLFHEYGLSSALIVDELDNGLMVIKFTESLDEHMEAPQDWEVISILNFE